MHSQEASSTSIVGEKNRREVKLLTLLCQWKSMKILSFKCLLYKHIFVRVASILLIYSPRWPLYTDLDLSIARTRTGFTKPSQNLMLFYSFEWLISTVKYKHLFQQTAPREWLWLDNRFAWSQLVSFNSHLGLNTRKFTRAVWKVGGLAAVRSCYAKL
jgi:hypothetical protein